MIASANTPKLLDWKSNLRELPLMLRQLFWMYGIFIVVLIIIFGILAFMHAPSIAADDPIAHSICALTAIFWGLRLVIQWLVFDAKPLLTNHFRKDVLPHPHSDLRLSHNCPRRHSPENLLP